MKYIILCIVHFLRNKSPTNFNYLLITYILHYVFSYCHVMTSTLVSLPNNNFQIYQLKEFRAMEKKKVVTL